MSKYCVLLTALCVASAIATKTQSCKLKILNDPDNRDNTNTEIQIYPAAYSSPVDNLNNQIFLIYKAQPSDGCTRIVEPTFLDSTKVNTYPSLVIIDGDIGICGLKRRIQMAKDVGAKGLIILSQYLDDAIQPYGDYSDNTFLIFIADSKQSEALKPQSYILATISSPISQQTKPELQFWLSTLNQKSYEIINFWEQTLKDIPSVGQKVNWKPRYALWGCNSRLFTPGSACQNNSEYLSSCACGGEFCSPQTKYLAADATVKEDARQKIIFLYHRKQFIPYMQGFARNCLKNFQVDHYAEDCAYNLIQNLGITVDAVENKLNYFIKNCSGEIYQSMLIDKGRFTQLGQFPVVILERQPIQFNSLKEFQTVICKKLSLEQQEGCARIAKVNTVANFTVSALFFVFIIGGLIAIVAVLLLIYRKTIRKQMQKQMKMQVSASVQHYFALAETK